jgi:hypothetical protein
MSEDIQSAKVSQGHNSPGIFDMLDLNEPLQRTYQAALKNGDLSLAELLEMMPNESPDEVKVYLNLLAQLNYLEKYKDGSEIRFRVKGRGRGKSALPDELWDKLES